MVAILLHVIAAAVVASAVSDAGVPWGYRGHAAIVVETTGTVELAFAEAHRARSGLGDVDLQPAVGQFLDAGDEVRVGRFSEARLRAQTADVVARDGARVSLGDGTSGKPLLVMARGLVEVALPPEIGSVEISTPLTESTLILRGPGGQVRILVDGRAVRAWTRAGVVEVRASGGTATAEAGKMVVVGADRKPVVQPAASTLEIQAQCTGSLVDIQVPDGAQVFARAALHEPVDGKVEVDAGGKTQVPIFARDVVGNVAHLVVDCAAPTPVKPPAPRLPVPATASPTPKKPGAPPKKLLPPKPLKPTKPARTP